MPLVRIDLRKGKDAAYRREIGLVVYEALVGVGVPTNDRFQVRKLVFRQGRSPVRALRQITETPRDVRGTRSRTSVPVFWLTVRLLWFERCLRSCAPGSRDRTNFG